MGMVYYGNYYVFRDWPRRIHARARHRLQRDGSEDDDTFIVVAESHCRYLRPARYDDLLRIRTRVSESRRRTIRFGYEILRTMTTRELLATGETAARHLQSRRSAEIAAGKISPIFSADGAKDRKSQQR